jgi:hypothetical protein
MNFNRKSEKEETVMKNQIFQEKQRFNDKLLYGLLGVGVAASLAGFAQSLSGAEVSLSHAAAYLGLILLLGGYGWWLSRLRLKVEVTDRYIKFKMSPFHAKARKIAWEDVVACEVVKTPRAALWHGGNIRFSGEANYSLTGRNGLSIITRDGQHFFIGCRDVDELSASLEALGQPVWA